LEKSIPKNGVFLFRTFSKGLRILNKKSSKLSGLYFDVEFLLYLQLDVKRSGYN